MHQERHLILDQLEPLPKGVVEVALRDRTRIGFDASPFSTTSHRSYWSDSGEPLASLPDPDEGEGPI